MTLRLALTVMLGLPAALAAQPAAPVRAGSVVPLPPIGLPLPQIGLPLPRIGLPAATPQRHGTVNQRRGGVHPPPKRGRRQHRSPIYILPAYGWSYVYDAPVADTGVRPTHDSTPAPDAPTTGRLRLDVEPDGGQQVFVDGYYVGTPEDLDDGLELAAGPHTLEIRRDGYEPLQVSVSIAAGRSITYRGGLKATVEKGAPSGVPAVAAVTPAAPMTGYIIPGCYVGNVPPTEVPLPTGCDPSRVITINP